MDQGSLVNEEIDAGEEFIQKFNRHLPLKAAFWLKASDDERRYLYVAADGFDPGDLRRSYREASKIARAMKNLWLDPFRIKLITGDDPLALAAADLYRRFPGRLPTRIGGGRFGGVTIDDVYLYPALTPATVP